MFSEVPLPPCFKAAICQFDLWSSFLIYNSLRNWLVTFIALVSKRNRGGFAAELLLPQSLLYSPLFGPHGVVVGSTESAWIQILPFAYQLSDFGVRYFMSLYLRLLFIN